MMKHKVLVGIGHEDWDLQSVEFTGDLVERRGNRTLYCLSDGRFMMHSKGEGYSELYLVSRSGHQAIDLEQALGLV